MDSDIELTIHFQASTSASVLVIVLGVLGGVLFVFLVVGAICLVKRSRDSAGRVEDDGQLPSDAQKLSV